MERSIQDILQQQFKNGEFNRVDVVVRYLAIGNFYGKNDYGYDLYRNMYKMCFPKREMSVINSRIKKFDNLIGKYKDGKFNLKKYPINMTPTGKIWDGSHRLSISIYHNEDKVNTSQVGKDLRKFFNLGTNRFTSYFSEEDMQIISSAQEEIFRLYKVEEIV